MNGPRTLPAVTAATQRTQVKLERVNCNYSKPYSPDGQQEVWLERLKRALGTTSVDFVDATLVQIQNASRLPSGELSELSVNAVLAFIEGSAPQNEVEAALAIQMGCAHAVTMTEPYGRG